MTTINLPDLQSLYCLQRPPKAGDHGLRGQFITVILKDGTFLLSQRCYERASTLAAPRIEKGGLLLLAEVAIDAVPLAKSRFDAAWLGRFRDNSAQMMRLYSAAQGSQSIAAVNRTLFLSDDDAAVETVRRVLALARSADIRGFFGKKVVDLGSYEGRIAALQTVSQRLQSPLLRQRMESLGITAAGADEGGALGAGAGGEQQRCEDEEETRLHEEHLEGQGKLRARAGSDAETLDRAYARPGKGQRFRRSLVNTIRRRPGPA